MTSPSQLHSHLTITPDSFEILYELPVERRRCVKHIWFKMDQLLACDPSHDDDQQLRRGLCDNMLMRELVARVLDALAAWEREPNCPESLTLEVSACSAGDGEHFGHLLDFDSSSWEQVDFSPPRSGNDAGRATTPLSVDSLARLFSNYPICIKPERELPKVQMVRGFVWRRQTRRTLHQATLVDIAGAFPNLEFIRYEPWTCGQRYCDALSTSLPQSLRELTLFKDFNEEYHNTLKSAYRVRPNLVLSLGLPGINNDPSTEIAEALAKRSLSLVRLSASYLVDAGEFFAARDPRWVWNSLESLSLTAIIFVIENSDDYINKLLAVAGSAALHMPRLKTMDVWYGNKGNASAFTYEATDKHTTIKWQGTLDLVLDASVIRVWGLVAKRHTNKNLTVEPSRVLSKASIKSHAVAIQELGLGPRVIHPVSLKQIARETGQ